MMRASWIVVLSLFGTGILFAASADRANLNRAGYLALQERSLEKAEGSFQQACRLARSLKLRDLCYAHSLNGLATVHQSQRNYQSAEMLFQDALEVKALYLKSTDADYAATSFNLALLYQQQGRLLESCEIIQDVLHATAPQDPSPIDVVSARYALGSIYLALGDLVPAEKELSFCESRLERLPPSSPLLFAVRHARAQLKRDSGELEIAEKRLDELRLQPVPDFEHALVELDLALTHASQGNLKRSLASAKNAYEGLAYVRAKDPDHPTVLHADRMIAMLNATELAKLTDMEKAKLNEEINKLEVIAGKHEEEQKAHLKQVSEFEKQLKDNSEMAETLRKAGKADDALPYDVQVQFHKHKVEYHKFNIEYHKFQVEVQHREIFARQALINGDRKQATLHQIEGETQRLHGEIQLLHSQKHDFHTQSPAGLNDAQRCQIKDLDRQIELLNKDITIQSLKIKLVAKQTVFPPTVVQKLRLAIQQACRPIGHIENSNAVTRKQIAEAAEVAKGQAEVALKNGRLITADPAWVQAALLYADRSFAKAALLYEKAYHLRSSQVVDCFEKRQQVLLELTKYQTNSSTQRWRREVYRMIAEELKAQL